MYQPQSEQSPDSSVFGAQSFKRSVRKFAITLAAITLAGLGTNSRLVAGEHSESADARLVPSNNVAILKSLGSLPLSFEANSGQSGEQVKFLSRGAGYTVFLTSQEAVLALIPERKAQHISDPDDLLHKEAAKLPEPAGTSPVVRMKLAGANQNARVSGIDPLPGTTNYLRGKDPRNWQTGIVNYSRVRYEQIYPGIDLVYYGNQGHLEYDFVAAPGSDPGAIHLNFAKGNVVRVEKGSGNLLVKIGSNAVSFEKPVAYQGDSPESRQYVDSNFVLSGDGSVGFRLGAYDHSKKLVIDPVLSYSTYLGGTSNDYGTAIAIDSTGSAYITGYTTSSNFPVTPGAFQSTCGGGTCSTTNIDAFVTKLNSTGTGILYSTYIGGSGKDYGYGIAVDPSGDAFIAGTTFSSDFPTTAGAFQKACGGSSCAGGDGFVTELNSTGSGLVYSTYLGGSSVNQINAVALDSAGDTYVVGYTKSSDYPVTAGVFQPKCSSCSKSFVDAVITKLNSSGSALVYSSYLGGGNADVAYAVALDSSGSAYVTGYTYSTNFPVTASAFQSKSNAPTAPFVSKVNSTGSALTYSTYLGGSATGTNACPACATSIAVDSLGEAYVVGLTWETNFPTTTGAYQINFAGGFHDAFVSKLNSTGTGLIYSTYIGGTGDDGATSVTLDSTGTAYIKGNTFSTNFPTTPGAFRKTLTGANSSDAFVLILNPTGSALNYSTYLGGSGNEYGSATTMIAVDNQLPPDIYVTGYGNSTDFPVTTGALQTKSDGLNDAFAVKFAPSPNLGLSPSLNFGNQNDGTTSAPLTITVTNTGNSTLNVSSVALSGTNASDFKQTNTCLSAGIAPQATCSISVTFTPTISGNESASVTLIDNAPDTPQSVAVSGIGVGAGPAVTLSATSLTFATQLVNTASPAQTVTLTNVGTGNLSITSITTTGDFSQTNNCGTTVAMGASCTINVTFTPIAVNTRTGTVTITDNAAGSPQTISLTGTGTYLSWTPTSLSFGNVTVGTSSAPQTISFTNHGSSVLMIKSITTTGVNNLDYTQTNTCGTSLAKLSTCTITVTFSPLAKGVRNASVTVSDFQGANTTQSIPLSGTGQ